MQFLFFFYFFFFASHSILGPYVFLLDTLYLSLFFYVVCFREKKKKKNMYPNLKTTCHIELKFFLWTKLLKSLLLAKYLRSVAAPLTFCKKWSDILSQCLVPFISRQIISYSLFLGQQPLIALQIQNFH